MGAYDQARSELITVLGGWDFSPVFPGGYTGTKGVLIVDNWPMDLIRNMQTETNGGQLTKPIVSVVPLVAPEVDRTFGNNRPEAPTQGYSHRVGRVVAPSFLVTCWADLQTGGGQMVEALAGQVEACCLYNCNLLNNYRRLEASGGHLAFNDAAQLWYYPVTVHGRLVSAVDS